MTTDEQLNQIERWIKCQYPDDWPSDALASLTAIRSSIVNYQSALDGHAELCLAQAQSIEALTAERDAEVAYRRSMAADVARAVERIATLTAERDHLEEEKTIYATKTCTALARCIKYAERIVSLEAALRKLLPFIWELYT